MKTYRLSVTPNPDHDIEYVPAEVAQGLYNALKKIDADLESRNFLENSSLRDTARAALAAADGESDE